MNRIKKPALLLAMVLILTGCIPEEGNSDLSGSWTCQETSEIFFKSSTGTSVYQVTFERDAVDQDQYLISNFYKLGSGVKVIATRSGYSITIPAQSVNGFVFEGSGTINETFDMISMVYEADDGGGEIDPVTAEYSR